MRLVEKARTFALAAHGEQRYGGRRPYRYHLERVAGVVREYGAELGEPLEELEAAAWLHDTVEDTAVTTGELEREFGPTVAMLVEAVTNEEAGAAVTYRKTRAAGRRAVGLKLCDRIANLRASQKPPHRRHLERYRAGYETFRSTLYREGELPKLWAEVARLIEG